MDNQEYLNQISSNNRPIGGGIGGGILSSTYGKIGIISGAALILIILVGSILGGGKGGIRDQSYDLSKHIQNTMEVISRYQPRVKSSTLRSSSASLYGVLSNTDRELSAYLDEKYKLREKDLDKDMLAENDAAKEELDTELFEARINGILDRIYAHKMAYEISVISSKESKILNLKPSEDLKLLLDKSMSSLDNLYNNFNDFTEGNK